MLKYLVVALIALGIYIGVTYKDQIEDLTDSRQFEEVHDVFEDASDRAADAASDLSDKLEGLSN
ncbi:YtxH domain-containing protein [Photobacterium nomapromontoriensis]|uniref:YtxH domain-containing protein n=1 Tax=Photobacterium nomapromontoriensis TaxID=2910237 RepID=UPI003D0D4DC7